MPWLVSIALVAFAGALLPDSIVFRVEPRHHLTLTHSGTLPAGTCVDLELQRLPGKHSFLINRCVENCNTSKLVTTIEGSGLDKQSESFTVAEPGRYYFWMRQISDGGEATPVAIEEFKMEAFTFTAKFQDGATVVGHVNVPQ